MFNNYLKTCLILFVILAQSACTSEEDKSRQLLLNCADLLSIYAQKPEKLEFLSCSEVKTSQVEFEAKYIAASESSNEIMNFLVKNYGLKSPCEYYFSMPMNSVYLEPKRLLEIDPHYVLNISVRHKDFEDLIMNRDCETRKNMEFFVYVQVLVV